MKSILDRSKIARRATLSNIASVSGLMILLASVLIPLFRVELMLYANLLLVTGLGVAMTGIYFANRWVKKPRPETSLDGALKSLSNAHQLYHYPALGCDHVLLTPNGVVALETVNLAGQFTYTNGRWKEQISIGRALRYIVEEHLGNPVKSAERAVQDLKKKLSQELGDEHPVPVKAVVVFTHPAARLKVEGSPLPVCTIDKLRKHVQFQGAKLDKAHYDQVAAYLESKV